MKISIDIIAIINIIAVVQGYTVSLFLFIRARQNRNRDNLYLAVLYAIASTTILYGIFIPTSLFHYVPYIVIMIIPFKFLIGPLIYIYDRQIFGYNKFKPIQFWSHAIPAQLVVGEMRDAW